MIKAYKLYTGNDGHSHFEEGYVAEKVFTTVSVIHFRESPVGSVYDWHTAPTTQYVICLAGTLEFQVHSGATFVLRPGEVLIAMDTTGSGHSWKLLGEEPWRRAYVPFDVATAPNFVQGDNRS
jgi:hypothetical protein